MERAKRKVIAVNENTGERRAYDSVYACAKALGVRIQLVQQAQSLSGCAKGWRIYDTPDRLRERIAEMQEQIKMLEG